LATLAEPSDLRRKELSLLNYSLPVTDFPSVNQREKLRLCLKMSKPFNYAKFEEELEILLAQDVIAGWEGFGPGHYRINGELDIWPRRKKCFYLPTKEMAEYTSLREFLEQVLFTASPRT
jgi:hypothetical protein